MRLTLKILAFGVSFVLLLTGCKKKETVEIHENLYVSGNVAPPYNGVTTIQVSTYVNKIYIDLLGEEPSETQLNADVAFLEANNLSDSARQVVIENVMADAAYYDRLWIITSTEMLEGVSPDELDSEILTYQYISDLLYQQGDTVNAQIVDYLIIQMNNLDNAGTDYASGTIGVNEFYKRFIFNLIYDEINMGSENFAVACFENLFNRYPTVNELSSSVTMVDGFPAILLLQDGSSKEDFIGIVTNTSEFYEGLVSDNYLSLLLREPTSTEMTTEATMFEQSGDLQTLQKNIIKTDEYAGF